ncbi:MAG: DUF4236 domain-containing protein [Clostridia bacterium]|nr:DUF4236 domain-containing protein [Clostridia bacterium]
MGSLRFRKSVSICKGVRLNLGKKGVSISAGVPGFRKTYNFNTGKTTTSIGIPGTGIYYTDTSSPSKKKVEKKSGGLFGELFGEKQSDLPSSSNNSNLYGDNTISQKITTKPVSPLYSVCEDTKDQPTNVPSKDGTLTEKNKPIDTVVDVSENCHTNTVSEVDESVIASTDEIVSVTNLAEKKKSDEITYDTIKFIFENCDVAIDWIDVISHRAPTSDDVVPETWDYLHKKAVDVFDGNIDALLEIISTVNPYDDLLDYAEDFEFSTDDCSMIDVEFSIIDIKLDRLNKSAFEDYYCAIAVRVARDTFALLPVENVNVKVMYKNNCLLSKVFCREWFIEQNLQGKDPSDIVKTLC